MSITKYIIFFFIITSLLLLLLLNIKPFFSSYYPSYTNKNKNTQKIVIIRHAEKPKNDLGLISCKGFNRALLLPKFFKNNFPPPDYIFAPVPAMRSKPDVGNFYYVRPTTTIEPTAIYFNKPINLSVSAINPKLDKHIVDNHSKMFAQQLLKQKYHNSTIYISWEHLVIPNIARAILQQFNLDTSIIPQTWSKTDFDSVYVFDIDWNTKKVLFQIKKQYLDNVISDKCSF